MELPVERAAYMEELNLLTTEFELEIMSVVEIPSDFSRKSINVTSASLRNLGEAASQRNELGDQPDQALRTALKIGGHEMFDEDTEDRVQLEFTERTVRRHFLCLRVIARTQFWRYFDVNWERYYKKIVETDRCPRCNTEVHRPENRCSECEAPLVWLSGGVINGDLPRGKQNLVDGTSGGIPNV